MSVSQLGQDGRIQCPPSSKNFHREWCLQPAEHCGDGRPNRSWQEEEMHVVRHDDPREQPETEAPARLVEP